MQRRIWLRLFDYQALREHCWLVFGAKSCRENILSKLLLPLVRAFKPKQLYEQCRITLCLLGTVQTDCDYVELGVEESAKGTPMVSEQDNSYIPIPIHPTRDLVNL